MTYFIKNIYFLSVILNLFFASYTHANYFDKDRFIQNHKNIKLKLEQKSDPKKQYMSGMMHFEKAQHLENILQNHPDLDLGTKLKIRLKRGMHNSISVARVRRAARKGYVPAQYELSGHISLDFAGLNKINRSNRYLEKAAKQGYKLALFSTCMRDLGKFFSPQETSAFLEQAAADGYFPVQELFIEKDLTPEYLENFHKKLLLIKHFVLKQKQEDCFKHF